LFFTATTLPRARATRTHIRTHARTVVRTHARMHARTHARTHARLLARTLARMRHAILLLYPIPPAHTLTNPLTYQLDRHPLNRPPTHSLPTRPPHAPSVLAKNPPAGSYSVEDALKVPTDIAPGDYVLGWRWDCEKTSQIWSSCSDITIE
jgi:hypothetical protein